MTQGSWLGILSVVLVLIVAPLIGTLILGPVNRAAGRLKAPTRFLLPDFMWLLVQLQLALGYCVSFVGVGQRYFFPLVLGFLTLASLMMWAGAVSFLSRAGVRSNLRRGVFILLLLPATLAMMIVVPLLPVVSFILHEHSQDVEELFRIRGALPPHAGIALLVAGAVIAPLVGAGLHQISRWMASGVPSGEVHRQPAM